MKLCIQRFRSYYALARRHEGPLRAAVNGLRFLSPLYAPWWWARRRRVRQMRQAWIRNQEATDD